MKESRPPLYYGWYIVGVSFGAFFVSVGTGFYAFNAFLEPLGALRGWTRTDLNLAMVIGTLFGFLSQYVYGSLLMRVGARRLMLAGALAGGLAFIGIGRATQLWQFYLCYAFLFIGNGAYGGIVANTIVNNWFIEKRGQALGIATAGISFSGVVVPLAALAIILQRGPADAALCLGLMVMAMGPLAFLIVRDWPEEIGLLPDGGGMRPRLEPAPLPVAPSQPLWPRPASAAKYQSAAWPLARLIRTPAFWKLAGAYALMMIGTVGVMSQLKPRFTELGFTDTRAMAMMAAAALTGTAGKYVWGMFCDRFEPRKVVAAMALANAAGLGLGLIKSSLAITVVFIGVFGFAMGGIMSTCPIMVAALFGRESFPAVLRVVSVFLVLQLSGYLIAGQSFDRLGTYDLAYGVFLGLDLLAAALLLALKPPAAG